MSTIGTVVFWLALFWTPALALAGYLLLPRQRVGWVERSDTHRL